MNNNNVNKDSYDIKKPKERNEKEYHMNDFVNEDPNQQSLPVPWHSILTSTPFVVVMVTHVGNNWGFYCLLTELPTYLKNMQHYDMKEVCELYVAVYLS